ncbi:MAG: HD domain-containing protein, partial [Halioglobus sp.]|nr:HD domain-containing protein [Halioglobus sp.]
MVQVRRQSYLDASGGLDVHSWLEALPLALGDAHRDVLARACEVAREAQGRSPADTGDWAAESNCLVTGLDMAQILADLHVDHECLVAAVLYRAVREERVDLAKLERDFGPGVSQLLRGVLRMAAIGELPMNRDRPVLGQAHGQNDNVRKMLIALVDDVRVALIKLAERTCALRAVKDDEQRRRQIGQQVFDVYAPLAHRLGIGQLKWEL